MDSSDEADPTFDESAAQLVGLFEASKTWTVHEMLIEVATSSNNDTPRLLNLTTTFSCNQKEPTPHQTSSKKLMVSNDPWARLNGQESLEFVQDKYHKAVD